MEGISKDFQVTQGKNASSPIIGKNDSFWLPPKAKFESFSARLEKANNKSHPKPAFKTSNNARSSSSRDLNSYKRQVGPSQKFNSKTVASHQKITDALSKSFFKASLIKKPSSMSASVFRSSSLVVDPSNSLKSPNNFPHLLSHEKSTYSSPRGIESSISQLGSEVNTEVGRQPNKRSRAKHGTKSASLGDKMDITFKTQLALEVVSKQLLNVPSNASPSSKRIFVFAGKELIPRISYLVKDEKKIVRFAMDLPNGSQLGVRIERCNEMIKLCFITSDNDADEMIETLKQLLSCDGNSEDKSSGFQVFRFQTFEKMDQFFKKAA